MIKLKSLLSERDRITLGSKTKALDIEEYRILDGKRIPDKTGLSIKKTLLKTDNIDDVIKYWKNHNLPTKRIEGSTGYAVVFRIKGAPGWIDIKGKAVWDTELRDLLDHKKNVEAAKKIN